METLNLVEKLKGCPVGTTLFSPIFGEVKLKKVHTNGCSYPIEVICSAIGSIGPEVKCFSYEGKYFDNYANNECLLFPSRECRDWSQFVPPMPEPENEQEPEPGNEQESEPGPVFRPFDRVLVRDTIYDCWDIAFFKEEFEGETYPYSVMGSYCRYKNCIPYKGNERLFKTTETPQG